MSLPRVDDVLHHDNILSTNGEETARTAWVKHLQ